MFTGREAIKKVASKIPVVEKKRKKNTGVQLWYKMTTFLVRYKKNWLIFHFREQLIRSLQFFILKCTKTANDDTHSNNNVQFSSSAI